LEKIDGTRNVMEASLETGIKKVVHVSSIVTWGRANPKQLDDFIPGSGSYDLPLLSTA
jgi:nucleoside-diphosphate-sugar epimerase